MWKRQVNKCNSQNENEYLDHVYTLNQDEIHDVMREWRDMFDQYQKDTGKRMSV